MCGMDSRTSKAAEIVRSGGVREVEEGYFLVRSQRDEKSYDVFTTEGGIQCSCADYKYRGIQCKHIRAVVLHNRSRSNNTPIIAIF